MDRRMRKRLYRAAQAIIGAMFALDLIAIGWIDYVFVHRRPSKPGGIFTIEYPGHGTSTFISNADHQLFILTWVAPFALLAISGLLYQFNRPDWRRLTNRQTPL